MSKSEVGRWTSAFVSHAGSVRPVNEDACLEAPDLGFWAVADGMGGHEGGQAASRAIVDALEGLPRVEDSATMEALVRSRLAKANRAIFALSQSRFGGRTIGSTVAVLFACGKHAVCLWAGDSRIYRSRAGQLEQLTRDHSRVEDLIEHGLIERGEAASHPLASVITRAIGVLPDLLLDRRSEEVEAGDRFLLCSDGLTRMLSDAEIAGIIDQGPCDAAAYRLLQAALARGASDNVTAGIVEVRIWDDAAPTIVPAQGDSLP